MGELQGPKEPCDEVNFCSIFVADILPKKGRDVGIYSSPMFDHASDHSTAVGFHGYPASPCTTSLFWAADIGPEARSVRGE